MPAPQPIQFAHEIGPLGQLALAAGAAKARRADRSQQRAQDAAFIQGELDRRQRQNEVEADFHLKQAGIAQQDQAQRREAFALQNAAELSRRQARNDAARVRRAQPRRGGSALSRALAAATSGQGQVRQPFPTVSTPPGREPHASLESAGGAIVASPGGLQGTGSFAAPPPANDPFGPGSMLPPEGAEVLPPDALTPVGPRGGFVRGTPPATEVFTPEQAEQVKLLEQDRGITPQNREFLTQAIRSGITTPGLLAEMNRRRPGRDDGEPKIDGLTLTDWTKERNIRERQLSRLINDPDSGFQDPRYEVIQKRIEEIDETQTKLRAMKGTPQMSGNSIVENPNPQPDTGGAKTLKKPDAVHYLDKAGGDIDAAMQMAKDDGFIVQ